MTYKMSLQKFQLNIKSFSTRKIALVFFVSILRMNLTYFVTKK